MISIEPVDSLPTDLDALVAVADREGLGLVARLAADFRSGKNRFNQPGEALWQARSSKLLIGICGLNQDPFADPQEEAGRVRRLYVRPDWRRRGVASSLLDAVEDYAGRHFALLTAFTTDERARAFYSERGYETVTGIVKRSFQLRF